MNVLIKTIKIENRYRKDMGDIQALADDIKKNGLMHPVVIDSNYRLIAGERRIRAFELMGEKEIPARILNVPSLLEAEFAENELRKDFTPTERVAIAKAIEEEIKAQGERRGNPAFTSIPGDCPEGTGNETRAIAAEKAGFKSDRTYRRAKTVVRDGVPELQEAMDDGSLTINAAFEISKLPEEEQVQVLAQGPESAKQKAKEVRKSKSKKEATPKEDKTEKPKVNPDALKEGIFPAHIVAHQVKSMIDKIAWRDPKAVASLDIILTHAQKRKEDILKRVENDER
jgi:ParB-like chromosome segregation protein Spo0J